jgi:hydroxyacylglutathione hydrolase
MVTADLPEAPAYFPHDAALNREGAAPLAARRLVPLAPEAVEARLREGAVLLDVRDAAAYGAGHVPGALNVGLRGQFASWAGTLVDTGRPIVVAAEGEDEAGEALMRLARVGLENVAGHLAGGVEAWERSGRPVARLPQIAVDELRARLGSVPGLQVLDVRRAGEYAQGHVPGAVNVPLHLLEEESRRLDRGRPTAVICAGGYRSSAAGSILQGRGFPDLANVVGGTSAWLAAGYPAEAAPR